PRAVRPHRDARPRGAGRRGHSGGRPGDAGRAAGLPRWSRRGAGMTGPSETVAMVELRQVCAGYGQIDVLHGVDLLLSPGTVLAVLGPNGAGKTTLVGTMSGLIRPSSGQVFLQGHEVTGCDADALARAGLCTIPEGR